MVDLDDWLAMSILDLEWPVLHVALNIVVIEVTTNKTFRVEHGIFWVRVERVLCRITNTAYIRSDREVIDTHI